MIGTKYISTKYVDRNYNIHLQNTTTLLPIIQELFFHVIFLFCPAQIKNIYCFSQKKYQLKMFLKINSWFFQLRKKIKPEILLQK